MPDSAAERTEPATPKRRREARKRGDVAHSRDFSSTVVLAAALGLLASSFAAGLAARIAAAATAAWSGSQGRPASLADFHALLLQDFGALARALLPFAILLVVAALVGPLAQVGPLFASESLTLRWSRLDPVKGFQRFFSLERLVELGKALAKTVLVAGAAVYALRPSLGTFVVAAGTEPRQSLEWMRVLGLRVSFAILAVLLVLAVVDVFWVRWRYEEKLKMTRQEVRDELREREGHPQMRSRMRAAQRELTRQRMIAAVREADVVVRNPTHYAVALRYVRARMNAPTVVAKGRNRVALRILAEARRHGVPLVENPPLARALYRSARVGREIPEALYQAVAEVLAYVYRLDRRRAEAWREAS